MSEPDDVLCFHGRPIRCLECAQAFAAELRETNARLARVLNAPPDTRSDAEKAYDQGYGHGVADTREKAQPLIDAVRAVERARTDPEAMPRDEERATYEVFIAARAYVAALERR